MRTFSIFLFLLLSSLSAQTFAYSDFIGYGYTTCITCHFNGQGGGPLNDYGRALFATEVTARDVFPKEMSEEDIAAYSGFLGKTQLPWWIRPGAKYRGLWFEDNPGSPQKHDEYINMQNEISLALFGDKKQQTGLIVTEEWTEYPRPFGTGDASDTVSWFTKEYYLRWQALKNFWIYLGQIDKTFGLRMVDHTAVSRSFLGFGQFDQSQGFVLHWTYPDWELALNGFFGNGGEDSSVKQKGGAITGEYKIGEKFMFGGSASYSKSDIVQWSRYAIHSRLGLSKGSALLAEAGLYENKSLQTGAPSPPLGFYALVQMMAEVRRGYNLLSTMEYLKTDIKTSTADNTRLSFGLLMFPLPRTEFRLMGINGKSLEPGRGTEDQWQVQAQFHLSL